MYITQKRKIHMYPARVLEVNLHLVFSESLTTHEIKVPVK